MTNKKAVVYSRQYCNIAQGPLEFPNGPYEDEETYEAVNLVNAINSYTPCSLCGRLNMHDYHCVLAIAGRDARRVILIDMGYM